MTTEKDITEDWDEKLLAKITFHSRASILLGPDAGFCSVYSNRWWVMHPECGAIFFNLRPSRNPVSWGSPACNPNEAISTRIRDDLYPGAPVEFISRAYVPIDLNDYR